MNNLLTNPMFAVGQGLLASSGPSMTPGNPWAGISGGLLMAQRAAESQKVQQLRDKQMSMVDARQAEMEREAQARQTQAAAQAAAVAQLPPDIQALARANPSIVLEYWKKQNAEPKNRQMVELADGRQYWRDSVEAGKPELVAPDLAIETPAFEGSGIEAQSLNALINTYPPEQREQVRLDLAKQRLTRPTTVATPQGTHVLPGYNLGTSGAQPASGQGGFVPKDLSERAKTDQYVARSLVDMSSEVEGMAQANPEFDPTAAGHLASRLPGIGNFVASAEYQQYSTAGEEWARQFTFMRSGAQTRQEEAMESFRAYWPQPGDKAETVKTKAIRRKKAEIGAYKKGQQAGRIGDAEAQQAITSLEQQLTKLEKGEAESGWAIEKAQ